ncbi:PREDICTED: C5a anaphylatoxin chemotactic receptor 1-like [Cyprinodon variegatus]|uniref:C5a anaphylatoxin chemotactic receptor 1-like n=1 Tax=Cyprinodon variegatus TaxID=28743 RepID=UPI00074282C7|nr:PREDICTED: C5a anaphylatoxin chemotactic receptor 1-like [Cyprinodon variegatus]
MDFTDVPNISDGEDLYDIFRDNYTFPIFPEEFVPEISPIQIFTLVLYALVVLLGVPGNALVLWVTGFRMKRSVTSIWFLNLALADLLCCLSLPLLMVPLAHDDHWHFGPLACTLVKGLFYLVMYCSVLQLVLISLDRLLLVKRPIWCQNHRRSRQAAWACGIVWCLALVGSIPQFVFARQIKVGEIKRECVLGYPQETVWPIASFRFMMGFILPLFVIIICHLVVYSTTQSGRSRGRVKSKKTLRVIIAVVLTFFLCWLPLHIMDFIVLATSRSSHHSPRIYLAHVLTVCLAYFNSCLNPLIYVCIGKSFKDSMSRSLRQILHFPTEDAASKGSAIQVDTKSTSNGKETSKI